MSDLLQPPRVLVVSPTFHPEKVGTPLYATDLVRQIDSYGIHVRVVTNQPYYPRFERLPGYGFHRRRDRLAGINIYRLPTVVPRRGRTPWRILSDANMFLQSVWALLRGRIQRSDAVLAVSPGSPGAIIAGRCLRTRSGRLTVVVHDVGFGLAGAAGGRLGRVLKRPLQRTEVWALNTAQHVTVLSRHMRSLLQDVGVTVPIDIVELWPTVSAPNADPRVGATVLYSGNLGRKQGVNRLIDLAADLQSIAPEARLIVRGEGPERERLAAEARARRLTNVAFEDLVEIEQLSGSLAGARVHVVPQLPEGAAFAVPSKVINVLAVGRPVVVTAHPDSPVGDLAAQCPAVLLADPDEPTDLARTVGRILSLPDDEYRELCETARRWAGHFSQEDAVRRTLAGFELSSGLDQRSAS